MADAINTLPGEIWKPVPGYEGFYSVSSLGRTYRHSRWVAAKNGSRRFFPGQICQGHRGKKGYERIKVFGKNIETHRIVCLTFHGEPPSPKYHAAHANDIKHDNRAENLRWATAKENAADRKINGRQVMGERVHCGKLTAEQVLAIRAEHKGRYGDGVRLSRKYGVNQVAIISIVKRRTWKHI